MSYQVYIIAKNTFLEAIRSKILHSVLLFGVLIVALSALFGSVSIGETHRVIKSFGYTIISISSVICVVISGVSLFQKEMAQKTIYNILSKPVLRSAYLLGKFFGLWFTGVLLASLMIILLLLFLIPFEGRFDYLGFQALYFIILELGIISSVTILFSAVSITPVLPGLFAFCVYLAGKTLYYLKYFIVEQNDPTKAYLQLENSFLKILIKIFDWVLPDLHLLTPYDQIVYGESLRVHYLITSLGYSVTYAGLLLLLSSILFVKRDV